MKEIKPYCNKFNNYSELGSITKQVSKSVQYKIYSIKDLEFIVYHFDIFYLITQKRIYYKLLIKGYYIVKDKEHRLPSLSERGGGSDDSLPGPR